MVRVSLCKGFMFGRKFDLPRTFTGLMPQSVDHPVVCDRGKPRGERPLRIVAVPDRMDGQQHVLYGVFNIGGMAEAAPCDRSDVRFDLR